MKGGGGGWGCSSTARNRFSKSVSFLSEGETFIVFFLSVNSAGLQALGFFFLFLLITTPTLAVSKNAGVTIIE